MLSTRAVNILPLFNVLVWRPCVFWQVELSSMCILTTGSQLRMQIVMALSKYTRKNARAHTQPFLLHHCASNTRTCASAHAQEICACAQRTRSRGNLDLDLYGYTEASIRGLNCILYNSIIISAVWSDCRRQGRRGICILCEWRWHKLGAYASGWCGGLQGA